MSDLIKRQDAISTIQKYNFDFPQYMERFVTELRDAMKADLEHDINELPSSQKTGKWTIEDCHAATYKYCCSECNAHHRARYDFCPTCGTRMVGDEE